MSTPSRPIPLPPIRRETLPGGLRVVVAERPGVPLVAVRLALRAGSALDPAGRAGLAHLTAITARRGTRRWTGPEIDLAVESLGADLGSGVDEDSAHFGLSAPVEALPRCLDVLAEVVTRPAFPAREVDRLRRKEVASIAHDLDEPSVLADRAVLRAAFAGHPYGHPPEGRVRDLRAARRGDVRAFHERHFAPEAATLVVVGKVGAEAVLALVRRRFGGWRARGGERVEIGPPAPPATQVVVVDRPDLTQSQVRIAAGGFPRASPDYHPGMLASALLGGGFTSRLVQALRVERGLTYGVRSRFVTARAGGIFLVSTFTKVESTAEIVRVALGEAERFCGEGPGGEEMERTKSWLCGLFPLGLETHDQVAEKLADLAVHGLPDEEVTLFRDRVRGVTPEQVRDAARRYFPIRERVVVAVGPAKEIAGPLGALGAVTVVKPRSLA